MFYANDLYGNKIEPTPKSSAHCPICSQEVISKCGRINAWHWAHKSLVDCDDWTESDSEWHLEWKVKFPIDQREVNIDGRRADIYTEQNEVIKLINSNISVESIEGQEEFFSDMIWIINADDFIDNIEFRDQGNYTTFRWKYPRKHLAYTTSPTILDLNDGNLFIIKKMHKGTPCGGWGYIVSMEYFFRMQYKNGLNKFKKKDDGKSNWTKREYSN